MIWRSTYRFLLLLLLLLTKVGAKGQRAPLYFEAYTTENGLPQNLVKKIIQDKTGFIWLITNEGLTRFDGYRFDNIKPKKDRKNSLPADFLTDIVADKYNGLWIGTFGKGLVHYDQERDKFTRFYDESDSSTYNFKDILSLYIDKTNHLWIGTSAGIYSSTNELASIFKTKQKFTDNFVAYKPATLIQKTRTIYQDKSKNIWLGTDNGLFLIDKSTNSYKQLAFTDKPKRINDILEYQSGYLLIATDNGLFKYNKLTKESVNLLGTGAFAAYNSSLKIDQLSYDKAGNLWIGTYGEGLLCYNPDSKQLIQYIKNNYDENCLRTDMVSAIYIDEANTLFVGLRGKGLNVAKIRRNYFSRFRKNSSTNSISSNIIWGMHSTSDNELWICTHNGLNKFMPESNRFKQYFIGNKNNKDGSTYLKIAKKDTAKFYLSLLGKGLVTFNKNTGSFKKLMIDGTDKYDANYITGFYKNTDTTIILSYFGKNMAEYNLKGKKKRIITNTINNYIRALYKDKQANIWLGSWGSGLYLYKASENEFENFTTQQGLSSDYIFYIYQDKEGYLWLGTSSGITKFNPATKKTEETKWQASFSEEVYSILEDQEDNLWVGTNNGLFKINKTSGKRLNFNTHDGLQSNEFNTASCAKTPDGHMIFGGINGLNYFHPDSIKLSSYKPQIIISKFSLFYNEYKKGDKYMHKTILSKPIEFTDTITLSYNENVIELNFSALDYFEPSEINYAYRLLGFEKKWVNTNAKKRLAVYTNLKPGNYIFQVKSTNSDGVWNDKIKQLHIVIEPAFWQTTWFKILTALLVVVLFVLFYKLRLRKLKKQKLKLEQLVKQQTTKLRQSMQTLLEQKQELSDTNILLEEKHEEISQQSEELRIISEKLKRANMELEIKVKKRTKKLKKALDDSKKAENLIASFLSNMSHEIRTPMNAIAGFSQLITQEDITDEHRIQYNNIISQSVDTLLEQIDNIMNISKMHSGTYKIKNNLFPLNILFTEILDSFDYKIEQQKTAVTLKWEQTQTAQNVNLFADKQVFKQIIYQLVSNALKYTEKGEVLFGYNIQHTSKGHKKEGVFKIDDKKTQKPQIQLIIYVKDTGVGIDKNQQKHIFDTFKKIEGKDKLFRGTGLGLAIVKSLCDSIHAKIELKSEPDKGSVFTITVALSNN